MKKHKLKKDRYGEELPLMTPLDKRHNWQLGQDVSPGVMLYPWHRAICRTCGLKVLHISDPPLASGGTHVQINVRGYTQEAAHRLYWLYPGAEFYGRLVLEAE